MDMVKILRKKETNYRIDENIFIGLRPTHA